LLLSSPAWWDVRWAASFFCTVSWHGSLIEARMMARGGWGVHEQVERSNLCHWVGIAGGTVQRVLVTPCILCSRVRWPVLGSITWELQTRG
jgi:hypothetical protein